MVVAHDHFASATIRRRECVRRPRRARVDARTARPRPRQRADDVRLMQMIGVATTTASSSSSSSRSSMSVIASGMPNRWRALAPWAGRCRRCRPAARRASSPTPAGGPAGYRPGTHDANARRLTIVHSRAAARQRSSCPSRTTASSEAAQQVTAHASPTVTRRITRTRDTPSAKIPVAMSSRIVRRMSP
jgi:hypothetical protein